jgi:hypothetical protein
MYELTTLDKQLTLVTISERIVELLSDIRTYESNIYRMVKDIQDKNESSWMIKHNFKESIPINNATLDTWKAGREGLIIDLNNLYDLQRKLNIVWFEKHE